MFYTIRHREFERTTKGFVCTAVIGCSIVASFFVHAAEPILQTPEFADPAQSFTAPVQTGTARRAEVSGPGLYQIPPDAGDMYCLGRPLARLRGDLVFVRAVDDFYTGGNVVWNGTLRVQGDAGTVAPPKSQGFFGEDGAFFATFRTEQDGAFQHNYLKDNAPNWYFPKTFDIIGVRKDEEGDKHPNPVRVEVVVHAPIPGGQAVIRVALNSNAPKTKENTLSINLNGTDVLAKVVWEGSGYRIIEHAFDASILREGVNTVELLGDASYIKHLDWVEIESVTKPALRNGVLVVETKTNSAFRIPAARHAVDITDLGAETTLQASAEGSYDLKTGRLYYFADHFETLDFGPEQNLALPQLEGVDYLGVGMRAMLPALNPLLRLKEGDGLKTATVAFEDIVNVYNGGLYGPSGIVALLEQFRPGYLLLAGGFHRDSRGRIHPGTPDAPWHPGIPAQMRHADQLTVSDDIYTLDNTIKVGRVPVRTREELAAWAAKAARYSPPDNLVLLSGENKDVDFSHLQSSLIGRFPAALIEADGSTHAMVREKLFSMMREGTSLVVYQGHGQSWEIDKGLLDKSSAAEMPTSSWILSTCNGGYYHADFDVYLRDWMTSAEGGCVNAIAAASVGIADQQDQLVRVFIRYVTSNPETDWGGLMHYLKRNMPYPEKTMNDPERPQFIRNAIANERKTIDAYSFLGDPAARVLAPTRRAVEFQPSSNQPEKGPLPPGPTTVPLLLSGPWDETTLARLAVRVRGQGEDAWHTIPIDAPLQQGINHFTFDSVAFDQDGGVFEVRVIEARTELPETVWGQTRLRQESKIPGVPKIMVRKMQPKVAPDRTPELPSPPMLICIARAGGGPQNMKATETQFQIRDSGQPQQILDDSGWVAQPRYSRPSSEIPSTYEIRARQKKYGNEGAWSEWTPMVPAQRRNAQDDSAKNVEPPPEPKDASILVEFDAAAIAGLDPASQTIEGLRGTLVEDLELPPESVLAETILSRRLREEEGGELDWGRWFLFTVKLEPGRVDLLDAIVAKLAQHPYVKHAEGDHDAFGWRPTPQQAGAQGGSGLEDTIVPDDPLFAQQYYHRLIQTQQAWRITTGSPKISVAVLDSGVGSPLEDLADRIDSGYDFMNDTPDMTEILSHGASILSLIAATGNNSIGIAGMDWRCRIIPVNMVEGGVNIWAQAIEYAVRAGARVINISGKLETPGPSPILDAALQFAADGNVVIVASAGNQNRPSLAWPASSPHVIAVGATDGFEHRWQDPINRHGSNYGPGLDLVAPGSHILALDAEGLRIVGTGTSFATALVSGTCALMLSVNPELAPADIRNILRETADKIGPAKLWTDGYSEPFGSGRLNTYAAVQKALDLSEAAST